LEVSYEAKQFLAEKGTDLKYGARPLRRAIQKHIEDEIAEMVLRNEITSSQKIYVFLDGENLKFEVQY
jgi:ATP-dependent Clp protease ATP-binding subunit ClpC